MMDFVTRLPWVQHSYDLVWVIVNRLTKLAYFLPIKMTYGVAKYA